MSFSNNAPDISCWSNGIVGSFIQWDDFLLPDGFRLYSKTFFFLLFPLYDKISTDNVLALDEPFLRVDVVFLPRDDLDLAITTRFVSQDYGASYGLDLERWGNVDFELDFQPSPRVQTYLFGHFEMRRRQLASINDSFVFPPSSDPNAGGAVFPLDNAWKLDTEEISWGVGTGVRFQISSRVILDVNYLFIHTEEEYDFDIAGIGALGTELTEAQDLPDLRTRDHLLQASVRYSIIESASLRFYYRFERSTIRDFSQRGLVPEEVLLSSGALFLGHIDLDYDVHVFGLTLQIRF